MTVHWKALRLRTGMSLERAGARAGVTSATARIFELDPEAIRDPRKRAALVRVYERFALAPMTAELVDTSGKHVGDTRKTRNDRPARTTPKGCLCGFCVRSHDGAREAREHHAIRPRDGGPVAMPRAPTGALVPAHVDRKILLLRGERVLLDEDLAALYGVETGALVRAVKRNPRRFPADFMFQLTADELAALRCQTGTSNTGRGGRRYRPYAFTEEGVAMLSSVLRSPRAVTVNVEIMRAFVRLRSMLAGNADLARKLAALEKKYDAQFRVVFDAIRELMTPPSKPKKTIGFRP
jgi:hypothetical protein